MGIDTARFALSEDLVAVMPIDVVAQVEGINRTVFTEFPGFHDVARRVTKIQAEHHAV